MTGAILIYICCANTDEAQLVGSKAVEASLAACANILPGMRSIYRWQGKIESASETVLLLKTRADLFDACADLVRRHHSYQLPCIVALPIAHGTADFLAWIMAQTLPAGALAPSH